MLEKLDEIIEGVFYGNLKLVKEALNNNVNPDFEYRGYTALRWAVQEGHSEIIKILLDNGANIENCDTQNGFSILDTSVGECADSDNLEEKLEIIKILLKYGADINGETSNGSVLHTACSYGMVEVVKLLINSGVNTSLKDADSKLAIDIAKKNGFNEIVKLIITHQNSD